MSISETLKLTIHYIVLSMLISSISIGPFVNYAEAKEGKRTGNFLNELFTSSGEEQNSVCTVFDSESPLLFNLGDIPNQILLFINSIFSDGANNSNMISIRDGQKPSASDVQKWVAALPVSPASAGYSLSLMLEDSLCEQIALSAVLLERVWNGFKEAFIQAYGEDLWITLLKDLGFFAAGGALTMGYAALHATPIGWVIDIIVGTILVAWIAYNAYTFYDLISQDRYEDLGIHIFGQINALVFGLAGVGAASIAIKTIPSFATFINAIRNRVSGASKPFSAPKGLSDLDNWPVVEEGGSYPTSYPKQPWESNFNPYSPGSGGGGTANLQTPSRTSVYQSPPTSPTYSIEGISLKADATAVNTSVAGVPGIAGSLDKFRADQPEYSGPQFDADGNLGILQDDDFLPLIDSDGGGGNIANKESTPTETEPDGYIGQKINPLSPVYIFADNLLNSADNSDDSNNSKDNNEKTKENKYNDTENLMNELLNLMRSYETKDQDLQEVRIKLYNQIASVLKGLSPKETAEYVKALLVLYPSIYIESLSSSILAEAGKTPVLKPGTYYVNIDPVRSEFGREYASALLLEDFVVKLIFEQHSTSVKYTKFAELLKSLVSKTPQEIAGIIESNPTNAVVGHAIVAHKNITADEGIKVEVMAELSPEACAYFFDSLNTQYFNHIFDAFISKYPDKFRAAMKVLMNGRHPSFFQTFKPMEIEEQNLIIILEGLNASQIASYFTFHWNWNAPFENRKVWLLELVKRKPEMINDLEKEFSVCLGEKTNVNANAEHFLQILESIERH